MPDWIRYLITVPIALGLAMGIALLYADFVYDKPWRQSVAATRRFYTRRLRSSEEH